MGFPLGQLHCFDLPDNFHIWYEGLVLSWATMIHKLFSALFICTPIWQPTNWYRLLGTDWHDLSLHLRIHTTTKTINWWKELPTRDNTTWRFKSQTQNELELVTQQRGERRREEKKYCKTRECSLSSSLLLLVSFVSRLSQITTGFAMQIQNRISFSLLGRSPVGSVGNSDEWGYVTNSRSQNVDVSQFIWKFVTRKFCSRQRQNKKTDITSRVNSRYMIYGVPVRWERYQLVWIWRQLSYRTFVKV